MDALALLALLPERRGRPRKRKRSSSREKRSSSREEAPKPKLGRGKYVRTAAIKRRQSANSKRKRRLDELQNGPKERPFGRSKHEYPELRRGGTGRFQQGEVQKRRFNNSGIASRRDGVMAIEQAPKVKGRSQWKRWTPEAIQRAAFAADCSGRAIAKVDNVGTAFGKKGNRSSPDCSRVIAKCIVDNITREVHAIAMAAMRNCLDFWITGHLADETKLTYSIPGHGFHNFSTLSSHSQCTWKEFGEDKPIRDEDVIREPEAMVSYNAATQFEIFMKDEFAGPVGKPGIRPWARFYGSTLGWDSHRVNKLTAKLTRVSVPPSDLILPSYCLQHHTGNTAAACTSYLNIFTRVWTLHKTFAEGDFMNKLRQHCHEILDDPEEGLEVVDPEVFVLRRGDLSKAFTNSIVNRALPSFEPEEVQKKKAWQKSRDSFVDFFPFGWNRERPLHPCPPGCCGPRACHSRAVSLEKAKEHVDKFVLRQLGEPASNKWTKMDPACAQATVIASFFGLVKNGLERKSQVSYEELAALSQEEKNKLHRAQDDQEDYKGAVLRYGKRCLVFVGMPDTKFYLLMWNVVGEVVMKVHFQLFKHCSWYSHTKDDEKRLSIVDFCPQPLASGEGYYFGTRNPVSKALDELAIMIFEPNSERGKLLLLPLLEMYGASIQWPENVTTVYQKVITLAFCKLWRQLRHRFLCNPWLAACIFDPELDAEVKRKENHRYWSRRSCFLDPWIGVPLQHEICDEEEDMLEDGLQRFVWTLFNRAMPTSTFIERTFRFMTGFTSQPQSRPALSLLKAKHVNNVFLELVNRWGKTLSEQCTMAILSDSGKCRDPAIYHRAKGSGTTGLHVFVKQNKEKLETLFEQEVPAGLSNSKRAHFSTLMKSRRYAALAPEERKQYEDEAKKTREQAKAAGAPVRKALEALAQPEIVGGPWLLSSTRNGIRSEWPLHSGVVEKAVRGNNPLRREADSWNQSQSRIYEGNEENLPDVSHIAEPCMLGECLCELAPIEQHRYETLVVEFRLALRHCGLPTGSPLLFELVCGAERRYCLIGDHDWTHQLRCDFLLAKLVAGSPTSLPFELGFQRETVSDQVCNRGWPIIRSEKMLFLRLVKHSSNPWHIYALRADPEQTWSYSIIEKIHMDAEEMREKETRRLMDLAALKLLKKAQAPARDPKFKANKKKGKGKRKGKGKGHGLGDSDSGANDETSTEDQEEVEEDGDAAEGGEEAASDGDVVPKGPDGFEPGPEVTPQDDGFEPEDHGPEPPPAPAPLLPPPLPPPSSPPSEIPPPPEPVAAARRGRIGEPWGKGSWALAPIRNAHGAVIGCGGTCKDHIDSNNPTLECKKQVQIGQSGLSYEELRLRMKRWLIAGLDDEQWVDPEQKRTEHVAMGGRALRDFAAGLSEEECDRIAGAS